MNLSHPEPILVGAILLPGFVGFLGLGLRRDSQKEGKKMKHIRKAITRVRDGRTNEERPRIAPATLPPIPAWPKRIFWASLIAAGVASLGHVAHQFGALEPAGPFPLLYHFSILSGLLAALAVDMTLVTTTWYMGRARRFGMPTRRMWASVLFLATISVFANAGYAFETLIDGEVTLASIAALDPYNKLRAMLLSATLPLIVIGLGSIAEEAGLETGIEKPMKRSALPVKLEASISDGGGDLEPKPPENGVAVPANDEVPSVRG